MRLVQWCFRWKGRYEGSTLAVSLGIVVLSKIGISDELLHGIKDENLEVSALGGYLGSEIVAEVGSSGVMLDVNGAG